jgi:hypothetical protein
VIWTTLDRRMKKRNPESSYPSSSLAEPQ